MLTPIEIQGITFKTGRGYSKKDVDSFMDALHHDYELMYKENLELKDKVATLSDGIQYYKNLEKTLQKALVIAEKTSEETKNAAQKQAEVIERQARLNADMMLVDARRELDAVEGQIKELMQQFELYKAQFKQIASTQLELLDTEAFSIKVKEREIPVYSVPEKEEEIKKEDIAPKVDEVLDKVDDASIKSAQEEVEQEELLAQEISNASEDVAVTIGKEVAEITEELKSNGDEDKQNDEEFNTEEDLEIKMLQKLLNEIKSKNEPGKTEKEELPEIDFEFINND